MTKIPAMILLLAVVFAISPAAQATAPVNNFYVFGGHTYHLTPEYMSWWDARDYAEENGGWLVDINSQAENTFLANLISTEGMGQQDVWTGFNDEASEGDWVWTTGALTSFTNWTGGEPNNQHPDGEDFASIYNFFNESGIWQDRVGTALLRGIVERPTPIPGAIWLLGAGCIGLLGLRKKFA